MGANVQVCWEKFCRYWEVEPRLVPMEGETYHLTAERAVAHCDENTIGVVAILGSTFDGSYEPVQGDRRRARRARGRARARHPAARRRRLGRVRGAVLSPELEWDFRLPRVQSINASGHKYGLVYPGVGWAIWRDKAALPSELVFDVNYLGGHMPTFSLNFSRPGSEVVAQYFMFMSLGRDGYTAVMRNLQQIALHISDRDRRARSLPLISDGDELPVFAFALDPEVTQLHGVRRLRPAARARLAGARLQLPGEPPGPQRAADRRARRMTWRWPTCCSTICAQVTDELESLDGPLPRSVRQPKQGLRALTAAVAQGRDRPQSASASARPAARSAAERASPRSTVWRSRIRTPKRRARARRRSRGRAPRPGGHGWRPRRRPCRSGSGCRAAPRR